MKRVPISSILLSVTTALAIAACEYEFKDDPGSNSDAPRFSSEEAEAPVEQEAPVEKKKPEQVARPVLAPGKDVSGAMALPDKVKKLNLTEIVESGALVVSTNVPNLPDAGRIYDEIDTTLAKSEGVNPFKVTFEFTAEKTIKAIRVLSTYSDYGWAIQFDNGERLVVDSVIDGDWSTVAFSDGVKVKKVTVEVLRKVRDNYVHLNEIELYE